MSHVENGCQSDAGLQQAWEEGAQSCCHQSGPHGWSWSCLAGENRAEQEWHTGNWSPGPLRGKNEKYDGRDWESRDF